MFVLFLEIPSYVFTDIKRRGWDIYVRWNVSFKRGRGRFSILDKEVENLVLIRILIISDCLTPPSFLIRSKTRIGVLLTEVEKMKPSDILENGRTTIIFVPLKE